jgi:hypothetical protein
MKLHSRYTGGTALHMSEIILQNFVEYHLECDVAAHDIIPDQVAGFLMK